MQEVAVIGLGKLGLPLAVCLADGGLRVHGVDLRGTDVLDTPEPCVKELAERLMPSGRLTIGTEVPRDIDNVIILVNTPVINSVYSTHQIEHALSTVPKGTFTVLSSTVSPGTCSRLGVDAYVPDFIALGQAVQGFKYPDVYIIGYDAPSSLERADKIFSHAHLVLRRPTGLGFRDAELAKIFLNNYIAMKISYANMISQYTSDSSAICKALGGDPRIGKAYFTPGPPWGGQCFPRDVGVLSNFTGQAGQLGRAVGEINNVQYFHMLKYVTDRAKGSVCVKGLAFKPGTDCTDNSPGMWLVAKLKELGYQVTADEEIADTIVHTHPAVQGSTGPSDRLTINIWSMGS